MECSQSSRNEAALLFCGRSPKKMKKLKRNGDLRTYIPQSPLPFARLLTANKSLIADLWFDSTISTGGVADGNGKVSRKDLIFFQEACLLPIVFRRSNNLLPLLVLLLSLGGADDL